MTDSKPLSAETLAALDEASRKLPDDQPQEQTPSPAALEFSKEVFTESLVAVMDPSSDWFSICALDTVVQAHKALATTVSGSQNIEGAKSETQLYATLRMLHCVHYEKMSQDIRTKLPGIVLEYLALCGLDDARGNELCGPAGWDRVKQTYSSFRNKWNEVDPNTNSTETEESASTETIAMLRAQIKVYQKQNLLWILVSICWSVLMLVVIYRYFN
ncbi:MULTISPECIES: hypothetical protein [Pseudomonas syringae group]|uniref:Uncharacterized protein n=1 Tax=Pseudomonas savastanoi pv. glycinea TaxID=318 RepID=A0A3M3G4F5_PSESG|nr:MULTISPECIES: hypothetical protein [Pseudomonas syringae group]RMM69113.1 hypothetical protein ALQ73_200014 [Pseudomonas savastanoi pv. glycinea]